jgi:hypothetical protein
VATQTIIRDATAREVTEDISMAMNGFLVSEER